MPLKIKYKNWHKPPSPRKSLLHCTLRKQMDSELFSRECGLSYENPHLQLDELHFKFEKGSWIFDKEEILMPCRVLNNFEKENKILREENNFLKVKIELLLVLLAEIRLKKSENSFNNTEGN